MDERFEFSGGVVTLRVKGAPLGASVVQFSLRNGAGQTATFVLDTMANAQRLHLQSNLLVAAATHGLAVEVSAKRAETAAVAIDVGVSAASVEKPTRKAVSRKSAPAKTSKKKASPKRRR